MHFPIEYLHRNFAFDFGSNTLQYICDAFLLLILSSFPLCFCFSLLLFFSSFVVCFFQFDVQLHTLLFRRCILYFYVSYIIYALAVSCQQNYIFSWLSSIYRIQINDDNRKSNEVCFIWIQKEKTLKSLC